MGFRLLFGALFKFLVISLFRFRLFCRLESVLSMPSFTFHTETFTASFLVCLPLYGADLREPDYGGVAPLRFIRSLHLTLSTVALISRVRRLSIKKDCSLEKWYRHSRQLFHVPKFICWLYMKFNKSNLSYRCNHRMPSNQEHDNLLSWCYWCFI